MTAWEYTLAYTHQKSGILKIKNNKFRSVGKAAFWREKGGGGGGDKEPPGSSDGERGGGGE